MAEPAELKPDAGPRPALLILHVGPPEPADAATTVYRTVQPCRALGELPEVTVISGSVLSPELYRPIAAADGRDLLTAADVLVIRDVGDPDLLPLLAARRREGRLTVFEPGQRLLAAPGAAPLADLAARSVVPQLARLADGVQVAGPGLEGQLGPLNPRRACFPSQLWEMSEAPVPRAPRAKGELVIGWMGGVADGEDLATALPALAGVLDRHPEARLALLTDPALADLAAALPAGRVDLRPAGTLADAQRFLDQIDIGLIPLNATQDRLLSDVRALEYAARGILIVCADVDPFRDLVRPGQTGLSFRDAGELETVLERALADAELRATVVAGAARAATARIERDHAADRLGFYLSLAAQRGLRWPPRGGQPASEWLRAAGPALRFPGAQYAALGSSQVERLLVEGCRRRAAGDSAEAVRLFNEAEGLDPTSHLPPLLLGGALADPSMAADVLARAEARRPTSCRAAYERGLRELARGDQAAATAAFEKARAIAPVFGAPQERLGQIAEAAGRAADAARLYEDAALQNPSFALPVARLALTAQRRGEIARAVALLERALAADPELPLIHLLLGRTYLALGRLHQARSHLERAAAGQASGWLAPLPAGFSEVEEPAAALEALATAENRG